MLTQTGWMEEGVEFVKAGDMKKFILSNRGKLFAREGFGTNLNKGQALEFLGADIRRRFAGVSRIILPVRGLRILGRVSMGARRVHVLLLRVLLWLG